MKLGKSAFAIAIKAFLKNTVFYDCARGLSPKCKWRLRVNKKACPPLQKPSTKAPQ